MKGKAFTSWCSSPLQSPSQHQVTQDDNLTIRALFGFMVSLLWVSFLSLSSFFFSFLLQLLIYFVCVCTWEGEAGTHRQVSMEVRGQTNKLALSFYHGKKLKDGAQVLKLEGEHFYSLSHGLAVRTLPTELSSQPCSLLGVLFGFT